MDSEPAGEYTPIRRSRRGERRHEDRPSRSEMWISNEHERRWPVGRTRVGKLVGRSRGRWRRSSQSSSLGGDALVFNCRSQGSDESWIMSWRYELLEEGQRLRAVEQIRGGGRDQDNIWIFERR